MQKINCPYQQNDNGKTMSCTLLVELGGPTVLAGSDRPSFICPKCQNQWLNGLPTKDTAPEILKNIAAAGKSNVEKPGVIQLGINFLKAATKQVVNGLPETAPQERKIRLEICGVGQEKHCEMLDGNRCLDCGCFVEEKSKWATADCGLNKWPKNKYTNKETKGGCGSCGTS